MRSEKIESYTVRYELLTVKEIIDSKKRLSRCTLDQNSLNNLREILQEFQNDQIEYAKLLKRSNRDPELYKIKDLIIRDYEDRAKHSYKRAYQVMMEARDNFSADIANALNAIKRNPELIQQLHQAGFDPNEVKIIRELIPFLGKPNQDKKILEATLNLSSHPLPDLKSTLMTATDLGRRLEYFFNDILVLEEFEKKFNGYLTIFNVSIYKLDLDHKQATEGINDIQKYEKKCHEFLDSPEFQAFQERFPERAMEIEKKLVEKTHEAFEAIYMKLSVTASEQTENSSWSANPTDLQPERNTPNAIPERQKSRIDISSQHDLINLRVPGENAPPQWTITSTSEAIKVEHKTITKLIGSIDDAKLKKQATEKLNALRAQYEPSSIGKNALPKLKKLHDEYSNLARELRAAAIPTYTPNKKA